MWQRSEPVFITLSSQFLLPRNIIDFEGVNLSIIVKMAMCHCSLVIIQTGNNGNIYCSAILWF